jgi:hypothetical protein
VFVAHKNIACTLKWPSLKAKIGKMKKSKFDRIDSRIAFLKIMPKTVERITTYP